MREGMKFNMDRRNFLKLVSLLPFLASGLPQHENRLWRNVTDPDSPNILILVFDTLSAKHISLYGYPRNTMPNLARFAERATVYHAHYAGGNFTTPGTASLFTGTYAWTHRALSHQSELLEDYLSRNIFSQFASQGYYTAGFSHNLLVNMLMHALRENLDDYVLPNEIALVDYNFSDDLFFNDYVMAARSERSYLKKPGQMSDSLFLAPVFWALKEIHQRYLKEEMRREFPLGIPGYHDMLYPLEDTIDWILETVGAMPQPFLAYMHMMPPHDPYYPRGEFVLSFYDEWKPDPKPDHFYSEGFTEEGLLDRRRRYDQYIAYVDAEFGRLVDALSERGLLDNTWIVFTSDHGEMFERGIWQHTTRTLFDPVIHVPLLISAPGQATRKDVYGTTSCVDVLPTLLSLTGQPVPSWIEGNVLPPFDEAGLDTERSIYAIEAKSNPKYGPLMKGTVAMLKGDYKLIYYVGYEDHDGVFELYDLKNDPEELSDLYPSLSSTASELGNELLSKIREVNQPYTRRK
jgi:arylsulfatase A-like enzyme